MAVTNRERVGKGLDLLLDGLKPFVERELQDTHKDKWQEAALSGEIMDHKRRDGKGNIQWDVQLLLAVMWDQWHLVFKRTLGHAERSLVSELREVRNKWAHQGAFNSIDAQRALDSMARLMTAVSAPQAKELEQLRLDVMRVFFEEQKRSEMRKTSFAPTEGKPQGGLKAWRDVVTPHPDVASGRYQQAEFAADLWQVYQNEGSDEYKNPTEFFRRTFITEGLKQLLMNGLRRLAGKGGDPVVELQTNFGGGKTHSMLALWHLFSGVKPGELPGVDELVHGSEVEPPKNVRRAVIVGTQISPGMPHRKPDGTTVHTLWGEIAWQLGGKEGYAIVRKSDETASNPGNLMKDVFNKYSPCVILIDEWVAYARQLHEDKNLPAGTFDTQFTFAQTISECAKSAKQTLLVVSIPSSENEIGGQWGQSALQRLKNAVGRVESSWRPASPDEGFEIVRRRLFQPLSAEKSRLRDAVAKAFCDFYGSNHNEFPSECREASYERRIQMAYPIHPELFDRLYNDWSTLDKFQRTRGVLRLMAAVIHSLWERQDQNLLILPGTIPVDDSSVQFELTRYMDDQWVPVIEKDVDGHNSLPLALDRDNPNLGRYSANRRVARTIYMGSAPTLRAANKGLEDRSIKLGCCQPGESVSTFGDALRRLADRATYLYVDGKRYWYSTQPTVTRLADDRAVQYDDHDVTEEIHRRLKDESTSRGDFARIHVCVSSNDIPDEMEARLVVLSSEHPHSNKNGDSPARKQALESLENRGNSPRSYRNTLVFLAADGGRLKDLQTAVRQYLAWDSIVSESETLNLDAFQSKQAETKRRSADETVRSRMPEVYCWALVPGQSDPKGGIEWNEIRLQASQDPLSKRVSKKIVGEGLYVELGGVNLRLELDRIPLWRGNHVLIKQLTEDHAKYLYLPRLKNSEVLLAAIADGISRATWRDETFAYADGFDDVKKRYLGLVGGQRVRPIMDGKSLVVKPDLAVQQMVADQAGSPVGSASSSVSSSGPLPGKSDPVVQSQQPTKPKRFYGTIQLDPLRVSRDASKVADEVVQHLTGLVGSNVEVTLEIRADVEGGVPDGTVRTITENCRVLKFKSQGFEKE